MDFKPFIAQDNSIGSVREDVAYERGHKAYEEGYPFRSPYGHGHENVAWERGWKDAAKGIHLGFEPSRKFY